MRKGEKFYLKLMAQCVTLLFSTYHCYLVPSMINCETQAVVTSARFSFAYILFNAVSYFLRNAKPDLYSSHHSFLAVGEEAPTSEV
jgi:hypothetical protein